MRVRPGCLWHTPAMHTPAIGSADWLFVVGESFLAALGMADGCSARAVVESLWRHADEPARTVEDIVGAIPLGKHDGVRSFAIVSFGAQPASGAAERTVTAVVRGSAVVDIFSVGGSRRFASGAVQPWMLADFRSVTSVILGGDGQPARPVAMLGSTALPVGVGVVRGQQLLWSQRPLTFESAEFGDTAGAASGSVAADARDVQEVRDVQDARDVEEVRDGETIRDGGAGAVAATQFDQTILSPRRVRVRTDPDDTVLVPRSDSRAAPAAQGGTRPAVSVIVPHRFRLADSAPRPLTEPAVFGRRPVAPRMPAGGTGAQLIAVESPDAAVSAVHLRIEQQGGSVVVTDLHSRNGTAVRPPGGVARRLHPGEAVVVLAGTTIDIGDGNIIEIMPPDSADQSGTTDGPVRGRHA
ncbi:MAG: FHA domain-containing protein [Microbacteriaceae bacterium]|nr:MAG: FHA domain-containing protein [Microbacteriaceae bacterium]